MAYMLTASPAGPDRAQLSGYYVGAFIQTFADQPVSSLGCRAANALGKITMQLNQIDASNNGVANIVQALVDPATIQGNGFAYIAISPVTITGGVRYALIADAGQFSTWSDVSGGYVYTADFSPVGNCFTTSPNGLGHYDTGPGGTDSQYLGVDLIYTGGAPPPVVTVGGGSALLIGL
jgi:hypothetical protein